VGFMVLSAFCFNRTLDGLMSRHRSQFDLRKRGVVPICRCKGADFPPGQEAVGDCLFLWAPVHNLVRRHGSAFGQRDGPTRPLEFKADPLGVS